MTKFPSEDEQEQYIDFLLDRVEFLEEELEGSEREKLALKQEQAQSLDFTRSSGDGIEEELPAFMEELATQIRTSSKEEFERYVLVAKAQLLELEDRFKEKYGALPPEVQRKSQSVHQQLDQLIRYSLRRPGE